MSKADGADRTGSDHELRVATQYEAHGAHSLIAARFLDLAACKGLNHSAFAQRPASLDQAKRIDGAGEVLAARSTACFEERLLWFEPGAAAHLALVEGSVDVHVVASSEHRCQAVLGRLTSLFQAPDEPEDEVPVTFWSASGSGAHSAHRKITCGEWRAIRLGYSPATRRGLTPLLGARSAGNGQLILWHGLPGTGKTHAVRALVRAWRDWCIPHLVSDPEKFLADSAYVMRVLTSGDQEGVGRNWRLIVLEDSGELLRADAREVTGQALSRILNITDGLLGQGMNALVLVTTNEPLGRLHPAIARPGRCWAQVEFEALPVRQANRWLGSNGCAQRVRRPTALADLWAIREGRREATGSGLPAIGFAAALE